MHDCDTVTYDDHFVIWGSSWPCTSNVHEYQKKFTIAPMYSVTIFDDIYCHKWCIFQILKNDELSQSFYNTLSSRQLNSTAENATILRKIQAAAKAAGAPKKNLNRIDLIERTSEIRKKSTFFRKEQTPTLLWAEYIFLLYCF